MADWLLRLDGKQRSVTATKKGPPLEGAKIALSSDGPFGYLPHFGKPRTVPSALMLLGDDPRSIQIASRATTENLSDHATTVSGRN
jgi:hypothetical protein